MDILIKGVEMPKGCGALTLTVWPNGQVEIIDADGEWKTSEAIPVPPHGRLIDADALNHKIYFKLPFKVFKNVGRVSDMISLVCDAPAVIEAEEGE